MRSGKLKEKCRKVKIEKYSEMLRNVQKFCKNSKMFENVEE